MSGKSSWNALAAIFCIIATVNALVSRRGPNLPYHCRMVAIHHSHMLVTLVTTNTGRDAPMPATAALRGICVSSVTNMWR